MSTTKSRKAKGRKLQNIVRDDLNQLFGLDLHSRIMGEKGADVYGDTDVFPFHIECKNQEQLQLWKELEKIKLKEYPALLIKRNRTGIYAVISYQMFLDFVGLVLMEGGFIIDATRKTS